MGKIKKEEKTKYEKTETTELWKEREKKIRNEEMRNVNKDQIEIQERLRMNIK